MENKIKDINELLDREIDILSNALYCLKIEDIYLDYNQEGTIWGKDDDNVWYGKEFYDFLINEVIVFEDDESSNVIPDEQLKYILQLGQYYGVTRY